MSIDSDKLSTEGVWNRLSIVNESRMSIEYNRLSIEGVCDRLSLSVFSMSHICLLNVIHCLLKVCVIDCLRVYCQ